MEIIRYIISVSIGGMSLAAIVIYLGKVIINKSSDLIVENHKNKLDLLKIEYQLKMSKLYEERAEVIKRIFQCLFELEVKLQELTTLFQGPEWSTDMVRDQNARDQLNTTREILEVNRIFFSEKLCNNIEQVLNECHNVITDMMKAKIRERRFQHSAPYPQKLNYESDDPLVMWTNAEKKVETDIKNLRMTLANDFREIIGVS